MMALRCSLLMLLLASCLALAAPQSRRRHEPSSIKKDLEGQSGDIFAEEKTSPPKTGESTKRQRPKYVRTIRKPPQVVASGMSSRGAWGDESETGADYSKPQGTKAVNMAGRSGWGDEMKGGADYSKPSGTKSVGRSNSLSDRNEAHLGPNYVDRWNKEEMLGPNYRPRRLDSGEESERVTWAKHNGDETECSKKVEMAVMMERARIQERARLMERERWNREGRERPIYQPNWIRNDRMDHYGPHFRTHMEAPFPGENEWVDLKDEIPSFQPFAANEGRCLFC